MWFFRVSIDNNCCLNLISWIQGKETSYYRFASVSLTALTICAFNGDGARRVRLKIGAD